MLFDVQSPVRGVLMYFLKLVPVWAKKVFARNLRST